MHARTMDVSLQGGQLKALRPMSLPEEQQDIAVLVIADGKSGLIAWSAGFPS